jgi:hypothetical protein
MGIDYSKRGGRQLPTEARQQHGDERYHRRQGSDSGVKHLAQETLQFADDASGGKAESH